MEGIQFSFTWNLTRRKSCGDHIQTLVGGRLPNLVCFGCKFPGILDILSHHYDVWGQVVEEEAPEHEAFSLVGPLIHREQAIHILPIKVDGFLPAARVRDTRAWYLWKGFNV